MVRMKDKVLEYDVELLDLSLLCKCHWLVDGLWKISKWSFLAEGDILVKVEVHVRYRKVIHTLQDNDFAKSMIRSWRSNVARQDSACLKLSAQRIISREVSVFTKVVLFLKVTNSLKFDSFMQECNSSQLKCTALTVLGRLWFTLGSYPTSIVDVQSCLLVHRSYIL